MSHDELCPCACGSCCPWMGECDCQCDCELIGLVVARERSRMFRDPWADESRPE